MRSFFKIFFATLLALIVFYLLFFFVIAGIVGSLSSKDEPSVSKGSIITIDLSKAFPEHASDSPFTGFGDEAVPTLSDVVRLIAHAKEDKSVVGIYLTANGNANGYASSAELREALIDFKTSKKFVYAYGTAISQNAYYVASVADKIYLNPSGNLDWLGFHIAFPFLKGTLEKLDVQTQIFYAGKYKSATEIFRTEQMTPENKLQTGKWLGDIYQNFLKEVAASRHTDTATLYNLAATAAIQTPEDALAVKLVDGLKYDDEVRDELKQKTGAGRTDVLNLVAISTYNEASYISKSGKDKIAVIYASGDIVDGEGGSSEIGGDKFRGLIRKARLDANVKAIVLRVNSGGGSALASDIIWREVMVARTQDKKPVVVSFGDVAASGGYYIASGADSIFAHPNTITGSIGVFGIIPNLQGFFKNKLGITFDGVNTAPYADAGSSYRPLNDKEKSLIQAGINRTYAQFKSRVATGRKKDTAYIETIAQGRVWSGADGLQNGLVDKLGNLQDAIACAARMAKLSSYGLKEYPEEKTEWYSKILKKDPAAPSAYIKEQIGEENFMLLQQLKKIKAMTGTAQARLPFEIVNK